MTTIANTRRKFFNLNLLRQPQFLTPAKLVATSATKLVNAPGLRESAREVRRIVAALKPDIFQAPKDISARAQEQIGRIDKTIASISPDAEQIGWEVQDDKDIRAGYLIEAQVFIDKLESLKAKLVGVKYQGYKRKVFYQGGITQDLDEYDRLFWEANREFSGLAEEDQLSILRGEIDTPRTEKLLISEAMQSITPERVLRNKIDVMLRHLHDKCTYASLELKQKATKELTMRKCSESAQSTSTNTQTSSIGSAAPPTPTAQSAHQIDIGRAPIVLLTPAKPADVLFPLEQQEEFATDLLNVISACGLSFYTVNHPVFKNFLMKYARGVHVPCQQILAGRVLDKQVSRAEEYIKEHTRGKLAMRQCDGWKNIARTPVIAVMMTVEGQPYVLQVHDVGIQSKTAENLVEIMKINMNFATEKYGVEWIAIAVSQREALLLAGGKTPKAKEAAKEVLDILNNDQFWMDTARTVLHLAPLAIASHITQAASTRLDHVLLTLA
ncbi:hypothetical protein FRC11_010315, partial [Ceratobasidium sp. 423]